MGREARLPRPSRAVVLDVEYSVDEDPWWLQTVLPDLAWARDLLAERDRRRDRARQALSLALVLASLGGRSP
jgi:hypothetical protein